MQRGQGSQCFLFFAMLLSPCIGADFSDVLFGGGGLTVGVACLPACHFRESSHEALQYERGFQDPMKLLLQPQQEAKLSSPLNFVCFGLTGLSCLRDTLLPLRLATPRRHVRKPCHHQGQRVHGTLQRTCHRRRRGPRPGQGHCQFDGPLRRAAPAAAHVPPG